MNKLENNNDILTEESITTKELSELIKKYVKTRKDLEIKLKLAHKKFLDAKSTLQASINIIDTLLEAKYDQKLKMNNFNHRDVVFLKNINLNKTSIMYLGRITGIDENENFLIELLDGEIITKPKDMFIQKWN